jgi:hypothetical protein
MAFKLRVLDLLEIFAKRNGESTALLSSVIPLLTVLRKSSAKDTESRQFRDKLASLLKNRVLKARGYGKAEEVDPEQAVELVEKALEMADTAPDREFLGLCSQAALLGAKVAEAASATHPDARDKVLQAYNSALSRFVGKKNTPLQASVFTALSERFPELGWKFATEMVVPILDGKGAAKAYPVAQGYNVVANAFQKIPAKVSRRSQWRLQNFADFELQTVCCRIPQVGRRYP